MRPRIPTPNWNGHLLRQKETIGIFARFMDLIVFIAAAPGSG
jgi:hypothetical protein